MDFDRVRVMAIVWVDEDDGDRMRWQGISETSERIYIYTRVMDLDCIFGPERLLAPRLRTALG
jgi:hypothetical protein